MQSVIKWIKRKRESRKNWAEKMSEPLKFRVIDVEDSKVNDKELSLEKVEQFNVEGTTKDIFIEKVEPLHDMKMILTFSNEEQRLFDASILTGTVFEPLRDETIFKNCSVIDGVVTWMNEEIDCAPEFMYAHSKKLENHSFVLDEQKADKFFEQKPHTSSEAIEDLREDIKNRYNKFKWIYDTGVILEKTSFISTTKKTCI